MDTIYIIMNWVAIEDGADLEVHGAYQSKDDCQDEMDDMEQSGNYGKREAGFWHEEVELH